jgi:hypothetical protein
MNYYHKKTRECFNRLVIMYAACMIMVIATITLAIEKQCWWALLTWLAAIGLFFCGKLAAYDYRRYKARAYQHDSTRIRMALKSN